MSNDYSNFDRRSGRPELARRSAVGNTSLYLMLGGAVVLAAVVGGLVVYELKPSAPASQETVAASSPAPPPSAAGAQTPPAPAQLPWTTVATYGSWQVRCQNPTPSTKFCTAVLEVVNQKDKRVLMAWIVGPDNKGALQTVFQTPTGVMVASGIDVKFGNAGARHVNYLSCLPQQCTAVAPMDEAFLKEAMATPKADVVLYASNGKSLDFGIPLTGIDKAIAAIKK